MVEDAPEGSLLEHILEQPQHLNMTLQFWNQTLLVLLLILLWPFRETLGSGWMLVAIMFVYIWIMDIVLPAVIISGNPSLWIERLFHLCSPIHKMLSPLLAPLVEKSQCSTERNGEEEIAPTEEAMTAFLEEGEAEGILEEEDSELIRNVVGFGDTIVREVMTPRTRIQGIADTATLEEVWDAFRVQRNSRMPVYNNTIDNIQGVLLLKDFIQLHGQDDADWISLARQPIFVPESKSTLELLRELQLARTQMAIVVDEYGAVAGLATVEDLLEEVVGEIQEEHEFSPVLHESSPGVYNVPGETHVEDLSAALGMELEHEGFDTVAGLVMSKLGRIPNPLETVHVDGLILRVMKMDGTRIVMVEVRSK
ncbi:MAG: hemolysin family protein [Holophagaceae bacterium]|nr:hemolysin family protein [Holophagaceae bacterium]